MTGRNTTVPPRAGELRSAVECYRRRQTTDDDRHQRPLLVWHPTLWVGGPVIIVRFVSKSSYVLQRISVAIQRFNSVLLHDTDCRPTRPIATQLLVLVFYVFNSGDLYNIGD